MSSSPDAMQKLILDSHALSIWNHKTGPVYWYAAGVPGPFYLNTELMIGKQLSAELLDKITAIVAEEGDGAVRAQLLESAIMQAYQAEPAYQAIIHALIEKAESAFGDSFTAVSGGERRDWLFSIPFAAETKRKHLYLFKNGSTYRATLPERGEKTLHVSDLINNAASYFDMWLPMLDQAGLTCAGTLTVNTRGTAGVTRLEQAGCKVAALNRVDLDFFKQSRDSGLISADTCEEIATYFASAPDWASRYLMKDAALFAIDSLDKKSFERMKRFFEKDPWGLRPAHTEFFNNMRAEISRRIAA